MERLNIQEIQIGHEEAVIVSRKTWERLMERLEDLEDVKLYDQAKTRKEKTIEHDQLCRELGLSPLRYLRNRAGLTQSQLARKTGLSQSYIAKVEANERKPSANARKKIARALGIAPEKLGD